MVGSKRLELLRVAPLVPKTSAYTNSANCPQISQFYILLNSFILLWFQHRIHLSYDITNFEVKILQKPTTKLPPLNVQRGKVTSMRYRIRDQKAWKQRINELVLMDSTRAFQRSHRRILH